MLTREQALKLFTCPLSGKPLLQAAVLLRKAAAPAYQPELSFNSEKEENFTYLICNENAGEEYLTSLAKKNFINPVTNKIGKGLTADHLCTVPIFEIRKLLEYLLKLPENSLVTSDKIEELLKDPITQLTYDCPIIILTNELKIPEPIRSSSLPNNTQLTQSVLHIYSLPSSLEKIIGDRDRGNYIDTLRAGKVNFMQLGLHIIKYKPLKKFLSKLDIKASEFLSIPKRDNPQDHTITVTLPNLQEIQNQIERSQVAYFAAAAARGFPFLVLNTFLLMGSFERKGALMVAAEQKRLLQQGSVNVTANFGNFSLIFETLKACVPETICPGFNNGLVAPVRFFYDEQQWWQWLNSVESFADVRNLQHTAGKIPPQLLVLMELAPAIMTVIIASVCASLPDVRWNKKLGLAAITLATLGAPSLLMTLLMTSPFYKDLANKMACGELCFENLPCFQLNNNPLGLATNVGTEIQFCDNNLQTYADAAPMDFLHTDWPPFYISLTIMTVYAYLQFIGIKNTANFLTGRLNAALTSLKNMPTTLYNAASQVQVGNVIQQAGRMASNLVGAVSGALGNLYGFWRGENQNRNNQAEENNNPEHPHQL